jgi:hypothetical protein
MSFQGIKKFTIKPKFKEIEIKSRFGDNTTLKIKLVAESRIFGLNRTRRNGSGRVGFKLAQKIESDL